MCGICGIIKFDNSPSDERNLRQMMQSMKHRGPDDEGLFLDDKIGFGFVRLSIIDLSPAGHQPMITPDGRFVMLFNGEIYNYIELREELSAKGHIFITKSDSEVLLHSYIEWGEKALHKFNGMWAFVIYDKLNKKIFAARDRYGIKPFYYYQNSNLFAFASEIPALLTLFDQKPLADFQSIFEYLVFNRTDQTENTFFKDIKKLQHGFSFTVDLSSNNRINTISLKKWYSLKEQISKTQGFSDAEEYRTILSSSIGLRLRSDVPVGVCLSGGLDSSSIVSILLRDYKKTDLKTFSAVYNQQYSVDESSYINEFRSSLQNMFFIHPSAETLQADLDNFIKAHAEPIPSTGPYAQYKVMELAKNSVVVTLDGQGADEELAGYHYFFGFFFKDLLSNWRLGKLTNEMFLYLLNHKNIYGLKSFLYFLLPSSLKTKLRVGEKGYLYTTFADKHYRNNNIVENLYDSKGLDDALMSHFEYKLEHLLKWEDRNSMWFSIEARVPFLDYRLVEKTLATPADMIIKNGMTKHILRESMTDTLPERIRTRKDKIGFDTAEDQWFKTPLWVNLITDILSSKSFCSRGIIDPTVAKSLYSDHLSGKLNVSKEIWKWIHLELWFRKFVDNF